MDFPPSRASTTRGAAPLAVDGITPVPAAAAAAAAAAAPEPDIMDELHAQLHAPQLQLQSTVSDIEP